MKKYFLKYKNINEDFGLIIYNNKNNNINDVIEIFYHIFVFIKNIITIFNKLDDIYMLDKIKKVFRFKISRRVREMNHSQKNYYY